MCDAYRDKLAAFVAGTLTEDDRAGVEAHLASCPTCRSIATEWRLIGGAVRGMVMARASDVPPYAAPDLTPAGAGGRRRVPVGNGTWLGAVILLAVLALSALRLIGLVDTLIPRGPFGPFAHSLDQRGDPSGVDASPDAFSPGNRAAAPTVVARKAAPIRRLGAPWLALAEDRVGPAAASGATGLAGLGGRGGTGGPVGSQDGTRAGQLSLAAATAGAASAAAGTAQSPTTGGVSAAETAQASAGAAPGSGGSGEPGPPNALRDSPTPPPTATGTPAPTTGTVAGLVRGPDGQPRAEILIVAQRDDADGPEPISGMTDVTGAYALSLPPGAWVLHAETPAYQLMWHPGKPNPIAAIPVPVDAGATVAVDFSLEPSPAGLIIGHVTDAGGAPIARAVVIAAIPDDDPDEAAEPGPILSAAVYTDASGEYRLALPPGAYFLAATLSRRVEHLAWWGGDGSFDQADRVGLSGGEPLRGIDLRLSR